MKPAQLLGVENGVYRIGLPNIYLRDTADRYRGTIRRALGDLVGDTGVPIQIEVM